MSLPARISTVFLAKHGQVLLVNDTFTGTNGTSLDAHSPESGGPWVVTGGFQIQGNKAKSTALAATRSFAYALLPAQANCTIACDLSDATDIGLVFNAQDVDHNFIALYASGNGLVLYEQTSKESLVGVDAVSIPGGQTTLKIIITDDTVTIWTDGVQRITYTQTNRNMKTNTLVGIMTSGVNAGTFDNFKVTT